MKIKDLSEYKDERVNTLMARIPFFKDLKEQDTPQFKLLLTYSCIVELDPGEIIMRRGDKGSWLYFLIKGNLQVFWEPGEKEALNHITPGELFGDLALLCDHERKATVAADREGSGAMLFATDFKPFGDVMNFTEVSLSTKLLFYRTMVHSIRWRLEVKRMEQPGSELAVQLRGVPGFNGEKGTVDELHSLHDQAQYLADLLDRWNSEVGSIEDILVTELPAK